MIDKILDDNSIIIRKDQRNRVQKNFINFSLFLMFFTFLIEYVVKYYEKLPININDSGITHYINENLVKDRIFLYMVIIFCIITLFLSLPQYKYNILKRKSIFIIGLLLITVVIVFSVFDISKHLVKDYDWNIGVYKIKSYYTYGVKHRKCIVTLEDIETNNNRTTSAPVEECSAFFQINDYVYVIYDGKNKNVYFLSSRHYQYTGDNKLTAFENISNNDIDRNYYLKKIGLYLLLSFCTLFFVIKKDDYNIKNKV